MAGEITLTQVIVRRHARTPAPSGAVRFDERLSVPWWWWPVAVIVIGLIEISVRLGHPEVPEWVPVVILTPLAALALVRLGRRRVSLTENEHGEQLLRVGTASLPARFIADAVAVAAADKQSLLGPELDPTAFVLHRPWVGPAVRIRLNDPEDPTPYWIFSVRHPEALLECLRTAHPG
ncbi:MAG TPA: DUF3093 domain-containing protein [Pseudonocardia sp.]|jgi:hypothetical protein|nr:DUF3093 domain-containing protein [Pseudonocardia sp.]